MSRASSNRSLCIPCSFKLFFKKSTYSAYLNCYSTFRATKIGTASSKSFLSLPSLCQVMLLRALDSRYSPRPPSCLLGRVEFPLPVSCLGARTSTHPAHLECIQEIMCIRISTYIANYALSPGNTKVDKAWYPAQPFWHLHIVYSPPQKAQRERSTSMNSTLIYVHLVP